MAAPKVTAVAEASPAARAGLMAGDELLSLNGRRPRDILEYHALVDGEALDLRVRRSGAGAGTSGELEVRVAKAAGEPLGIAVESAVFDRVRTCDNHCAFCFIHQLPKGMRRSLYLKDDDYRLSFLYGNFTTLTRFTELDAERVLTERLGPLFVSIHATDPEVRARMLRNPKGATSLRWLGVLLDGGIEVHGQVVVCPGVNDGEVLGDTLLTVLDRYPQLATLGVVPLGLSRYSHEEEMREHTQTEAAAVCDTVAEWQETYRRVLGRRLVYAADEYYLLAGYDFPPAEDYDGFPQHENGIGMARAFEAAFGGDDRSAHGVRPGFFAWVDGAPASGYRAPRRRTPVPGTTDSTDSTGTTGTAPRRTAVLTGSYGAKVLEPLLAPFDHVRVVTVEHDFFGGNIGVAGLLTGHDLVRALAGEPDDERYLLPDACLSEGRFLDGTTLEDLPRAVEVVAADGRSLRLAIEDRT
ncbi:MAG TPA: DUF512 domain-containing protein [Acidimicrobiales bacterium]|nr:DUF512 domain-containing protein [Acidimicrobiales bacterium]